MLQPTPALPMQLTAEDLQAVTSLDRWDYVAAVVVMAVAVGFGQLVRRTVPRIVGDRRRQRRGGNFLGDLIGRLGNYLIVTLGLIYSLEVLGIAISPILGALGIAGIAVAFAFQDILENFVAGIILQVQRPFDRGDEIVAADHEGTVTAIDTRTITLISPDGETIRLPSAEVLKNPIINHSQHGRRRTTIMVGVDYDSDLDHVTAVALDALNQLDEVFAEPAPEVLVGEFGASSIDLAVRYWHEPSIDDEWASRDLAARAIAKAFRAEGITIPFPQRVVHQAPTPGGGPRSSA